MSAVSLDWQMSKSEMAWVVAQSVLCPTHIIRYDKADTGGVRDTLEATDYDVELTAAPGRAYRAGWRAHFRRNVRATATIRYELPSGAKTEWAKLIEAAPRCDTVLFQGWFDGITEGVVTQLVYIPWTPEVCAWIEQRGMIKPVGSSGTKLLSFYWSLCPGAVCLYERTA